LTEARPAALHHQFEDLEQQRTTAAVGMWAFLVQEVMFFGGLFAAYFVYRSLYGHAFAEASRLLDVPIGAFNTAVLIGSSLTMAFAVREAQLGRGRRCARLLCATMVLGGVFLGLKAMEYGHKWNDFLVPGLHWEAGRFHYEGAGMFFVLYFTMTGMHALHMVVGIVLMVIVALRARRGRYTTDDHAGVEMLGLYWHFVDIVWIFLFPLLYLVGQHL